MTLYGVTKPESVKEDLKPTAGQAQSHYLNQWWLDYRRIYASLGLNECEVNTFVTHLAHIGVKIYADI